MRRSGISTCILLFATLSIALFPSFVCPQPLEHRADAISGGAEASRLANRVADMSQLRGSPVGGLEINGFVPGIGFLAYNYDDNGTETGGWSFIPPDPIGAAGTDRLISVVNVGIECRTKTGTLIFRDALKDFFSSLSGTLGTWTFDPKVVYDHYENRFVIVALERIDNGIAATDASRILVAVSKTSSPATPTSADWWYMAIDSKVLIGSDYYWADYPGLEVDEEAVYITNNMFGFSSGSGTYDARLWIIDKGVASGFYSGFAPSWNIYDPYTASGAYAMTSMPALVFGAGGIGPNIGTYLCGYSSLTDGGPGGSEYVQIIRIVNPLSSPSFYFQHIPVGDLEDVGGIYGWPAIPDAPQSGTSNLIEVNDSRALDAVWRNNNLWFTTTTNPNATNDPINTGQATAHWFRLDTTVPTAVVYTDQGNIGGEDIATGTWTFFPALAVNSLDDAKFGFAASASSIYCGAYMAGRHSTDPAGTVQASGVVQAGLDYYYRTFGAGRNRWGDYSGASVDPADDITFWIYNEYAEAHDQNATPPEDGRWGTAWRSCAPTSTTDFGDAPDPLYPTLLASNGARHTIIQGAFLGTLIDGEPDGLPHPNALGDDITNQPDEDGVTPLTPFIPGQSAQVQVIASLGGWLDVWFDWNKNGSWLDTGDKVYAGTVAAGINVIPIAVPGSALPGTSFARFRYNLGGLVLAPTGSAPDGEVEDYLFPVEEPQEDHDFGDAPDGPYPTLLASNGASHLINPAVFMGTLIDAEADGQPDATATGDDLANQPDEDGVNFLTPFIPGEPAQVDVIVSMAGWLDVWFDFNINGSWLDPGEQVYSGPVNPGLNPIPFGVPQTAVSGTSFARFRYNLSGALPPTGAAPDGEVEDYRIYIEELDYGDAPDVPYPTYYANNGARHVIVANMYMGGMIDAESDGQPDPNATGDDIAFVDDEDGVVFTTLLIPFNMATVDITVTVAGLIDAWIDFDNDGVWTPPEQIFASTPVNPGLNSLNFNVPLTGSTAFDTFARFRYSTAGGLQPTGIAMDGEIEDYKVHIENDDVTGVEDHDLPTKFALHDAVPNPFNPYTTLSFSLPSASHVRLTVYDVLGRHVVTLLDENRGPGVHDVVWYGLDSQQKQVASGVYIYRLEAGSFVETKRMVLLK